MFKHGSSAELWLDELDVSSYFRALDVAVDVDTADTTTFKKRWKTAIPGAVASTVETEGLYDPALVAIKDTLAADPGAVLTVGPAGLAAAGDLARLVSVLTTAYKESSPVGDVVAFNWTAMADGTVGFGRVLAPLAAVTADANGTTVDDGSSSTTGAIAHLHATAVSTGDTVDVTIEDASVPSGGGANWATIGTFAQVSAPGAQRLVIAGTVRRYVRAVWNVTDDGAPSITFGVALART